MEKHIYIHIYVYIWMSESQRNENQFFAGWTFWDRRVCAHSFDTICGKGREGGEGKRRAEGSISFNQIFIYLLELRTLRNIKTNRIACDLCASLFLIFLLYTFILFVFAPFFVVVCKATTYVNYWSMEPRLMLIIEL